MRGEPGNPGPPRTCTFTPPPYPKVAAHLDAAHADALAFTNFPKEVWRQMWSNNPQERLKP